MLTELKMMLREADVKRALPDDVVGRQDVLPHVYERNEPFLAIVMTAEWRCLAYRAVGGA